MKKPIVIIAALACSLYVKAQSLEEGIKMVRYERYAKAKEMLAPISGGNATANYYLGLAELGEENVEAAGAIFNKFPDDAANMAGMARVAFMKKNPADGMRLAQAAASKAKRKDWEPLKYAADAITYTEGGDLNQAISWYKTALEKNDNAATRIALGDAYRRNVQGGGGGQAMTNWESVTTKEPNNSLAWSKIGSLWYGARQYDRALEAYQKAKDTDPQNPIPYRDLANAYFYSGKFELAKQNIEKYLELSDKSCEDRVQYANLLYLTKDYTKAIQQMQDILSTCGDKPYPYRIIAYSQVESGDSLAALSSMRTYFAKQEPGKVIGPDYKNYAKIFMKLRQTDSSDYYYNKFIGTDTSEKKSELYKQIAEDFKALKNDTAYAKAGYWYGKVIEENADAPAIDYYNWGIYNYYGRNYTEGARAFEQMEAKYPDQPSATYWRARVAAATDPEAKTGAAKEYFLKWLAIPATEKYSQKPADKILAYQYLLINAYNDDDKAKMKEYMDELQKLDPNDKVLSQIREIQTKKATQK